MTRKTSGDNNLTTNIDAVSPVTVFRVTLHQSIGHKSVKGCFEVRAPVLCSYSLPWVPLGSRREVGVLQDWLSMCLP